MKIFEILLQLWQAISPYLTEANIVAVEAAIQKAITDFQGGNLVAVLADLAAALKVVMPKAADKIDAVCNR